MPGKHKKTFRKSADTTTAQPLAPRAPQAGAPTPNTTPTRTSVLATARPATTATQPPTSLANDAAYGSAGYWGSMAAQWRQNNPNTGPIAQMPMPTSPATNSAPTPTATPTPPTAPRPRPQLPISSTNRAMPSNPNRRQLPAR